MRKIVSEESNGRALALGAGEGAQTTASLVQVLWQHRRTVMLTVMACLFIGMLYLLCAKKVYVASARLLIDQNGPRTFSENQGFLNQSETFMQSQADAFESSAVLGRALDSIDYRSMHTFAHVEGDPAAWVRDNGFETDVSRKSDVITISMQSPYPNEALVFIDSVVKAYIAEQAHVKQSTGGEMLKVLQKQKDQLTQERERIAREMVQERQHSGVVSFGTDRGNSQTERMAALNDALTQTEAQTAQLRADRDSLKAALDSPEAMSSYVLSQQFKGRDFGDREYDDLRSELLQHTLSLSTSEIVLGSNNERVKLLQSGIAALKDQLAAKERAIYQAQLQSMNSQVAASEEKEKQLADAVTAQRDIALGLTPEAVKTANLEAEMARVQRQSELLDGRMAEVSVNDIDSPPLNIQVLDPARADEDPIKPKKSLVLAAAMMVGLVLGIGLAMLNEWKDAKLRTPDEIVPLLGTPVLAMVPRINTRLSSVARGQLVHLDARSPAAEAYRLIRTSLHLGTGNNELRTILVASPNAGDGKSTTASNLAIAFAQAGQRTLLVDCDMREPVQHLIFESEGSIGLSSVLMGEARIREAVCSTRIPNLYLLPCGPIPPNPSEQLAGKRFTELMPALIGAFDRIIIDSPPLTQVTDGQILAASADATVLVLRMNCSGRNLGLMSIAALQKVGANVVGAVANDVAPSRAYGYRGGSWQYAVSPKRLLASIGANGNGNGNGHALAARSSLSRENDMLPIDDPEWSTEVQ